MLGPHFYFDLIRLARKPRNMILRSAYLLLLLIAWWIVYEQTKPIEGHINEFADLASQYTTTLLIFQYVLIVLLTPIYVAGAVVEEKENRTLEMLYQTQLEDREILLGKFAARVVHLMFLVISILPMLAIISLWGGVSLEMLGLHFVFCLLLVVFISSVSLWASVQAQYAMEALVLAFVLTFAMGYAVVLPAVVLIGGLLDSGKSAGLVLGIVAALIVPSTTILFFIALKDFRRLRDMAWMKHNTEPPPRVRRKKLKPIVQAPPETPDKPVGDNAFLWLETRPDHVLGDIPISSIWGVLIIASFFALFYPCLQAPPQQFEVNPYGVLLRSLYYLGFFMVVGCILIVIPLQTIGVVARERQQNTLDFLLILPMDRSQILFWKWLCPWIRWRVALMVMTGLACVGIITGIFPIRAGLILLVLPWPGLLLLSALSLFLSVVCRRVATANILLIVIVLLTFLVHLVFWRMFSHLLVGYFFLVTETEAVHPELAETRHYSFGLVACHQAACLILTAVFLGLAFWLFARRTSEFRTQVW